VRRYSFLAIVAAAALWAALPGSARAAVAVPAAGAQRGTAVDSAATAGLVPAGTRAAPRWAPAGPGAGALGKRCFHVAATIPVRQRPDAVAVNPKTNTVYVANRLDPGRVSVISGQTDTVTATIPVGHLPAGVAVNPSTNTVFVANEQDSTVSVINGQTNMVVAAVPVSAGSVNVAVNPSTNTAYVTNGLPQGEASVLTPCPR
jgi:YVTN family beta-propeller protein